MNTKEFNKEKKELHMYWKQFKVNLITWDEIPPRYQRLLKKYYHITTTGDMLKQQEAGK